MKFEVKKIQEEYKKDFSHIIKHLKYGPAMLHRLYSKNGYVVIAYNENVVIGLLFFHIQKFVYFKYALLEYGSMIMDDIDYHDKETIRKGLYLLLVEYFMDNNVFFAQTTRWTRDLDELPEITKTSSKSFATFIVNLVPPLNEIYSSFSSSNKRAIKKANKNDLEIIHLTKNVPLNYIDEFQKLRTETQKRAVLNNKKSSMQLMNSKDVIQLLESGNSMLSLTLFNNEVICGALVLLSEKSAYYYIGGSDKIKTSQTRGANLLHYSIIDNLKSKGFENYDFGGSPVNPEEDHPAYGVYRFKKSFGGDYLILKGINFYRNNIIRMFVEFVMRNKTILRYLKNGR